MAAVRKPNNGLTVRPRMEAMSPYQMYLEQIKGISDSFRTARVNLSYIPPQFGGLKGQRLVLADQPVLQMIDFTNPN
jgi:hypothetical protein